MLQRRRLASAAVVAILVLLPVLAAGCGNGSVATDAAPGFDEPDRSIDTSPFELAGPDGPVKASTIPEAVFDGTVPNTIIPPVTAPTSTVPPTTAPGALIDPTLAAITSLCGFEENIGPFERLPGKSPAEAQQLMTSLLTVMARYREVAPEEARNDLSGIIEQLQGVAGVLAANGWDTRSQAYLQLVSKVGQDTQAGVADALGSRLGRVVALSRQRCG